jgi:hypothetical protein
MRRWIAPGAIALVGALGILALWIVRASGGVCVDGAYEDTGEFYGYCADYSSASGALPATIAIVLLVAAGFVFSRRRIAVVVVAGLVIVSIIAGIIANLGIIVYPAGYPV